MLVNVISGKFCNFVINVKFLKIQCYFALKNPLKSILRAKNFFDRLKNYSRKRRLIDKHRRKIRMCFKRINIIYIMIKGPRYLLKNINRIVYLRISEKRSIKITQKKKK